MLKLLLPLHGPPAGPVNPDLQVQSDRELPGPAVSLFSGQLEHSVDPDLYVFFVHAV